MILFIFGDYINVNRKEVMKGEFHENSQYLDWVETLGPMRPPPEPPPWGDNFLSLSPFSCIIAFHSSLRIMHELGMGDGLLT